MDETYIFANRMDAQDYLFNVLHDHIEKSGFLEGAEDEVLEDWIAAHKSLEAMKEFFVDYFEGEPRGELAWSLKPVAITPAEPRKKCECARSD